MKANKTKVIIFDSSFDMVSLPNVTILPNGNTFDWDRRNLLFLLLYIFKNLSLNYPIILTG